MHGHGEARTLGVEGGGLDAVVEREPGNVDGVDVPLAQQPLELGALEPRVPLAVGNLALVEDHVDPVGVDPGMKLRPGRVTHAVDRPRTALRHKRAVVGRVPVARGDHEPGLGRHPVDRLDDRVPVGHRQRAPGTEVVLDVDDDQRPHNPRI